MIPPSAQVCEVSVGDDWIAVSLVEARGRYALSRKRCSACHGAVNVTGVYFQTPTKYVLSHRSPHDGCPLRRDTFSGTARPHPQAIG